MYPQEQQDLSFLNHEHVQSSIPSTTFHMQAPSPHYALYHNVMYGTTCAEKSANVAKNATNANLPRSMYTPKAL